MTTAISDCVNYNINATNPVPPFVAVINASNYEGSPSGKPILPVTISLTKLPEPDTAFTANISIGSTIKYQLDIDANNAGSIRGASVGIGFSWPKSGMGTYTLEGFNFPIPNATVNLIELNGENQPYADGDTYIITLLSCFDSVSKTIGASVIFSRSNTSSIEDNICDDASCFCSSTCATVRIPIINISGQSMKNGSDISDMTFTIFDEIEHNNKKSIVCNNNKCQLLRLQCNELKKTTFIKCCPWMVSVARGKGKTLRDKLEYLISKNLQPENLNIDEFFPKIMKYGMTRYILSRILYGNFNIDYLLEKHYKKFIRDLGKSRFCRFIEFFQDCSDPENNFVGYEKYFLCDKKQD